MSMEMDHSFTVPVPPSQAWDVLLDVERIAPCMPGATVDEFDGEVVTGRIKVKVGPVSLTYRGTAKFTERDPDARVIVLEASGKETRGAGTASATVRATLEPESDGQATRASMHTTMNVTGRPAQFGRGVMVEVGSKLVDQFARNLAQMITDDGAAATGAATAAGSTTAGSTAAGSTAAGSTAAGSTPAGSTAGGSASAGDGGDLTTGQATATAEAGSSGAGPETVVPVATAPAPSAQQDDDSINLIRLVGPSLLKRVVPVVIALAGLALIIRYLFRRGDDA
jgi:uncharacterized protein